MEWKVAQAMGYVFQISAIAALSFGVWLFSTGGVDPDLSWGQFMLALSSVSFASIGLSLLGLRRIRNSHIAYWCLSAIVFLTGMLLLIGIFGSYSAGPEGADIGGILMMLAGSWGLAGAEVVSLLWLLSLDGVKLIRQRKLIATQPGTR